MANPNIETYRGPLPKCLNCGARIRAQYESQKEPLFEATGEKKIWLPRADRWETDADFPPPDNPKLDGQSDQYNRQTIYWSARKKKWYLKEKVYKTTSRKFTGRFGRRSDNFFCDTECGYRYGVKCAKVLHGENGQAPS